MSPIERVLNALRLIGLAPKPSGEGWACVCPAHDDHTPSLSIGTGDDGRAMIHCHTGCKFEAVLAALNLRKSDLFPDSTDRPKHRRSPRSYTTNPAAATKPAKTFPTPEAAFAFLDRHGPAAGRWPYHDASGEVIGYVVRHNVPPSAPGEEPSKTFTPISRTPGGWVLRKLPNPHALYRLPDLLAAPNDTPVWIVEGEKAADAARALGLVATTSAGGSNRPKFSDWSPLRDRTALIAPDHDEPGTAYAHAVRTFALAAGAASVHIVRLADIFPELPVGGDMDDYVRSRSDDPVAARRDLEALAAAAKPEAPDPADEEGAPIYECLADVKPETLRWLWRGRIAIGKLTLLQGDPGLGKSIISIDIAARVTTASNWPDAPNELAPAKVVLIGEEDGIADTVVPRLIAAGADLLKVLKLKGARTLRNGRKCVRVFDLESSLDTLERMLQNNPDIRLVVLDPISAYMGRVNSHNNTEVRAVLTPLAALAEKYGVAVLVITHMSKAADSSPIYRSSGSIAFAAASRAVWVVAKDRDDEKRRFFVPVKNNLGIDTGGLTYRIEPRGTDSTPIVSWEPKPVTITAAEALASGLPGERRTEIDDAADWLREFLADGPRPATEVEREAKAAGHSVGTLRRAKAVLNVSSDRAAFGGGWNWVLLQDPHSDTAQDAQPSKSAHLGTSQAQSPDDSPKMRNQPS